MNNWNRIKNSKFLFALCLLMFAITLSHYITPSKYTWLHDIYRRLYYIPIILSAFSFGKKGALICSLVVSLIYLPHAFSNHVIHMDSGQNIEKFLEILLYNIIALIVGYLADKEHVARIKQESVSNELQQKLNEIRVMEKQLIRAGRLKSLGELTAGLAHEIKNPLASLIGATDIIDEEVSVNSPAKPMVNVLKRELARLSGTLDHFLNFARPSKIEKTLMSTNEIIDYVFNLVSNQARKKKVNLSVDPSSENLQIRADIKLISQVLINVVINGIQAVTNGGIIQVCVNTKIKAHRNFAEILISDNGPGIDEETKDKIFNPFVTTKGYGTGLGLSISSRIIDQHDGYIEVDRLDNLTVFKIGVPL